HRRGDRAQPRDRLRDRARHRAGGAPERQTGPRPGARARAADRGRTARAHHPRIPDRPRRALTGTPPAPPNRPSKEARMTTSAPDVTIEDRVTTDVVALRRSVAAGAVGVFVHWFDWAAYAYLAGTVATVFFPSENGTTGLLAVFGVFAVSFGIR